MLKTTSAKSDKAENTIPTCLIVDDTDLPKNGHHIEFVGRIYKHVTKLRIWGFKWLVMAFHDGKSLFALDISLHCEKGKNKKKPFGLSLQIFWCYA